MIPSIIHQTWRDANVPPDMGEPDSWRRFNPDWSYRLWTDRDLELFMQEHFSELLPLYRSYPNPVQRADLARYCLLYIHGGVYADIDTRCLASLEILAGEDRVLLCEEPVRNRRFAVSRGLSRLYFNGTMASPARHPFWLHVIELCVRARHGARKDVIESTGPLILSAAVESWQQPGDLALHSAHLFSPEKGDEPEQYGPIPQTISEHLWAGTWLRKSRQRNRIDLLGHMRRLRHRLTRGAVLSEAKLRSTVDMDLLRAPLADADPHPRIAVFVPVRDGAATLERNLAQIMGLDYPLSRLRVVYCEGDSTDGSADLIAGMIAEHAGRFRGMRLIHHGTGRAPPRDRRWLPKYQRRRRAAIASVRNAMIAEGLADDDEWVLWLDCDVVSIPADALTRLLAERRKIVVPDCVLEPGGRSFDLNTYLEVPGASLRQRYKHMRGGIAQPPADVWHRRHLHDLRYLTRIEVDAVGGTMLLVHSSVHRAGLGFPERPYRDLIETEAFGRAARDLGVPALALPQVEIVHAPF
jgi:hypothetical protein